MSECADRLQELTQQVDVVLDEDLSALERMSARARTERYNQLKTNEEEFVWDFSEECPDFLTESERARVRGRFRLARLLVAASFYRGDGEVPGAMADDFIEPELEAVVEFDRYRQFEALSESQIERKIRRMDGEVYDLVEEYTSTQLANIEQMTEHPEIQQDLMERLLDRYEERREKIRRGFFTYVEAHGLEHMVEAIEDAVEAVNTASAERKEVRDELQTESESRGHKPSADYLTSKRRIEAEMRRIERNAAGGSSNHKKLQSSIDELNEQLKTLTGNQDSAASDIDAQIDRTTELDERLEVQIENLEETKEQAATEATKEASEKATKLVEDELEQLQEEREQIRTEIDRLKREREQVQAARESLSDKQETLETQISQVAESVQTDEDGIKGSNAVTTKMAKILEMDYLGRFDISMHETETVRMSDEQFEVPDGYWNKRSERRNNRAYLVSILEDEYPDQYPLNATARYEITSSGTFGFGNTTEMVIEASVVSNLDAYVTNGFDAQPTNLDTLLAIINQAVEEAEERGYTYLLGIASPTGWSQQVHEQVENEAKTRYSRHVSICLINLQDGSLIYDESDPVASENATLFAPPVRDEQVQDCVETVQKEYVSDIGRESVLLRDVVEKHEYDSQVVKRAFNILEEDGTGEQLYLDELGISLSFG